MPNFTLEFHVKARKEWDKLDAIIRLQFVRSTTGYAIKAFPPAVNAGPVIPISVARTPVHPDKAQVQVRNHESKQLSAPSASIGL
ncbi:hypothetical protein SAMN05216600_10735 [Pseudomonas cuatrocienegasensis]|uniref:Uncharacterized protein n=1 Tax=Pseudomonas cuatrocienegasensis TaxID=543360 RepID=A0ABY1BCP2_9PSED|nr:MULTISPECIES: hypothetical protein [Pseudomonas]OEC33628.1 hypothetical protein A7D25_18000 [Pseudomonas sp. 21C1]SEQ55254.1 hypothetical protein SAMN05216600_10735 [Pseudomonas cuatrocienegasensis]